MPGSTASALLVAAVCVRAISVVAVSTGVHRGVGVPAALGGEAVAIRVAISAVARSSAARVCCASPKVCGIKVP